MHNAPLVTNPVTIFFIVLAIIVLAPVLMNRLKIPPIVGMIIAGVIIGPYGLHILADDSSFVIFGQVGLLYLMFLAGLEIDMYHLKLNFKKGLFFGCLTFIIPLLLGVLTSYYILKLELITSFLLGAMYAAHTLISYPVAARYGLTKSPAVLIAVVGTIFAVAGSLIVLANVADIAHLGVFELTQLIWLLIKISIYVSAVLVIYPWATKLFLRRYSDRVTQYVFILALVFLSAWVAELIGLSGVLGAFLAGLVLNRYVPPTSPLMGRIEFVGNSIFIPYFLISVGMMVNLHLLANWDTLGIAVLMLIIALISKWLAAGLSGKFYKMSPAESNMMFGLTTAHTAVALAVVTIGYTTVLPNGKPMLSEQILNATILVILVTCAIAPIITAQAATKLRLVMVKDEHDNVAKQTPAINKKRLNLLVPVANPVTAPGLMELALLMSGHRKKKREIFTYLLHVRNDNNKKSRTIGETSVELATKVASAVDVGIIPLQRFDMNIVTGITNVVNERDIDMVMMGLHHKTTVIDTFLGHKIEQLLESTRKMLVVSRCYAPVNTISRIMVYVPPKAQLEEGFGLWVITVANLAEELGCRIVFNCDPAINNSINTLLANEGFEIRVSFNPTADYDSFVLLSKEINDDDMFIWIASRPNTVSWSKEQTELSSFLSTYLQNNNIIAIYPEVTEDALVLPSFAGIGQR